MSQEENNPEETIRNLQGTNEKTGKILAIVKFEIAIGKRSVIRFDIYTRQICPLRDLRCVNYEMRAKF